MANKRTTIRASLAATAAVLLVAMPGPASAYVIYSDDFSGNPSTNLGGQAPDVRPGSETWIASTSAPAWKADGSNAGNGNRNAWLPFVTLPGNVYTVSLDVNPNAGGDVTDWFSLGFSTAASPPTDSNFNNPNTFAWMLNRQRRTNSNDVQTFLGPSTTSPDDHNSASGTVNLKIVLDTQSANWTTEWFFENTSIRGPVAFTSNPAITRVGFGKYQDAQGFVDNFLLEALYEPPPPPSPFIATQTNDWAAEIPAGTYTHALNFGGSGVSDTAVNGVPFLATGTGAFPGGNGNITYPQAWGPGPHSNNITGDNGLADQFIHSNGSQANLDLTGLTAGEQYLLKLFSVGWNNTDRTTFINDLDVVGEEINFYPDNPGPGAGNGTVVSYLYTAQPDGELNISLSFGGNQSPHLYALTNQLIPTVIPEPSTFLIWAIGLLGIIGWRRRRTR